MKKVLTIAGSDSCGGAGIQADLKTMSSLGVYGMSVITAITAQNTLTVTDVMEVSTYLIQKQIEAIFEDIEVDAIKIGMLSSPDIIKIIFTTLNKYPVKNLVLDPVMISKSGYFLLKNEAIEELKKFIPFALLITPNISEAELLTNIKINNSEDLYIVGKKLLKMGAKNVLIKGGHLELDKNKSIDTLFLSDGSYHTFASKRINTNNTHGTGCTLSSAIASFLAKGYSLIESIQLAKKYISIAIKNSFSIGNGYGPVGHFIEIYDKIKIDY